MSDESRIQQLLEETLESGRAPEEVCAEFPELLWRVHEGLRQCQAVEAQIEAIFPPSDNGIAARRRRLISADEALPHIPGYQVEAVLGRGGVGVVYQAKHLKLNRNVALKMLLSGAYADPRELTRFTREAEAVASLQHVHIVQIYDVGEFDGKPYFTMEIMEGGSLAQKLAGTPQPAAKAAAVLIALATAANVAHLGGIVHRDLKPSNILLTVDGTPKVADFGLARRMVQDSAMTAVGAHVGTPSYMAPEQATGKPMALGSSSDIYSLGAILYEMLTGRPPFRGETAAETEHQVINDDPIPPSRLNRKVPRDLETICLKCLHKVPERRYPTAAELVADLQRFQGGEPILARRVGPTERIIKWVRRRAALSAVLAISAALALVLVGGAFSLSIEHAKRRQAVEAELNELATLQQRAQWTEAKAALDRAEARIDGMTPGNLVQQLGRARRDLDLVIRLDRIHLRRLTSGELPFYKAQAGRDYTAAFKDAGVGDFGDNATNTARLINASAVRGALITALDDWVVCNNNDAHLAWLFEILLLVDPDPTGWRERIRDCRTWNDPKALAALADELPVSRQTVSTLLSLGERLRATGGNASAFLKRVQNEYPADFWANLTLGDALVAAAPKKADGYYRAALASRPQAAVGYTAVGDSLNGQNLQVEALEYHRKAVAIDPSYARAHTNLGNVLIQAGRVEEAIASYRKALEVDSTYAWAHFDLANALRSVGRSDEALSHYRQFYALDSTNSHVTNILRADRVARGQGEAVRLEWKRTLEAGPIEHDAWFGYAELCLFLNNQSEYLWVRAELLRRFGATTDAYIAERVARASLLMTADDNELKAAAKLAQQAVDAEHTTPRWVYPYFLFAGGLAEYRQDHFDSAISIMSAEAGQVMGPAPRLVIAMAQYRKGQEAEARKTLAKEMVGFDWGPDQVGSRDHWIWHALRREAESLVLPNLQAFLNGDYQPVDNDERLALVGVCQFQRRYLDEAQLFAAAFASEPNLADGYPFPIRHKAACAAALAGFGLGEGAQDLDDAARARWRDHARQWLHAELSAQASRMKYDPSTSERVQQTLMSWKSDSDLVGLRETSSLNNVPASEREKCKSLWTEVDALINYAQDNTANRQKAQ